MVISFFSSLQSGLALAQRIISAAREKRKFKIIVIIPAVPYVASVAIVIRTDNQRIRRLTSCLWYPPY